MTKPSRFLENGRDAFSGVSFWVESAESSEKRIIVSGFIEPSAATTSAASLSPRRIASMASWIAVAPEAQAVVSEIGEPLVPKVSARRSPTEPNRQSMRSVPLSGRLAAIRSSYEAASFLPESASSFSRSGHSISIGGIARNSGPGKSARVPAPTARPPRMPRAWRFPWSVRNS